MKIKVIVVLICLSLIATTVLPIGGTFEISKDSRIGNRWKPLLDPHHIYNPEDIDLSDAAFHRSYDHIRGEWLYFEGIFNNGYSVALGVVICSREDRGFCVLGFHVYKDTEVEFFLHDIVPFNEFEASEEYPSISISGQQIIRFDREIYNTTGEWVYNISFIIKGQEAHLQFIGTTKGYKGEILRGWYGPVLPKATVEGTLVLNGIQINVSGLGYHEHGWNIPLLAWEWGWYWGKIVSDSFCLYWAKMMNTRFWEQTQAAVLSQDQSGYVNIHPDKITFTATKYTFDKWRLIPTKFMLLITDPENSLFINATMEVINIHHLGFGIPHFVRYHIKVNGEISYGSSTEMIIDEIQIMELVRLR